MANGLKTRWIIGGLLFLSLAANLFLGGWLFGSDAFRAPHAGERGAFFEAFNDKAAALPEPERAVVKEVLARHQPGLKKQMKRIMKSRDAIDRMYKRKNYSRGEAEERFNQLQEQSITMQQMAQAMMLDLADMLPPSKRAAFMERPKDMRGRGEEFRAKPKPKAKAPTPSVTETPPADQTGSPSDPAR